MMSASMNVRQYFLTMVNHLPKHQSLTSQFMVSNNPNRGSIPLISYSHSCRNQSKGLNKVLPTYLEKNPPHTFKWNISQGFDDCFNMNISVYYILELDIF